MKPYQKEIRRRPRRLHGASEAPGGANGTRRNTGGARGGRRDGASGDVWTTHRPEEGERGKQKRAKMQGAFGTAPHPLQTDRAKLPIAVTARRDGLILTKPKTTTKGKHMTGEMINAIVGAYDHAREKHPYFCDWLKPDAKGVADIRRVVDGLNMARARVADAITAHNVGWDDLLDCEVWEILDALANGDTAHAVSECYDAITALLRTVDVLEGRQPLGNPAKKGGAK